MASSAPQPLIKAETPCPTERPSKYLEPSQAEGSLISASVSDEVVYADTWLAVVMSTVQPHAVNSAVNPKSCPRSSSEM